MHARSLKLKTTTMPKTKLIASTYNCGKTCLFSPEGTNMGDCEEKKNWRKNQTYRICHVLFLNYYYVHIILIH